MGHGGARENSGRRSKYTDADGNPIKSRRDQVPEILSKDDIEKLAREKLANTRKQPESQCD